MPRKTATPAPKSTPVPPPPPPAKPAFRQVTAPGYTRKIRNRLGKITEIILPDIHFRVCTRCRHWDRYGGLHPRCDCACH
jgi:hypothetical protein